MSRTAIIALILSMIIFGRAALAAPCGDRIQGFNTYEDYDDNLQPDPGVSIFEIEDYSSSSSFEGILVKASAGNKLAIAFLKQTGRPAVRSETFELEKSEHKKGFVQAAGFNHRKVFAGDEKYFILSIIKDGQKACEDQPREIFRGE